MTFTDLQIDPLTGVCNRRGLDQSLEMQFAVMNRYGPVLVRAHGY